MTQPAPSPVLPAPGNRRSVFPNYPAAGQDPPSEPQRPSQVPSPESLESRAASAESQEGDGDPGVALARCFLHQFLARAFEYPSAGTWGWLADPGTHSALRAAVHAVCPNPESPLRREAESALACLEVRGFEAFHDAYVAAIGHAARGSSPINEIEYGDLKADPLLQPHRLADLSAFYRAFGLELGAEGGERHDHLAVELEFMAVLTGQEAHALACEESARDALPLNRDAQRLFLREHLGRWSPAFARRLQGMAGEGALGRLALFLLAFIQEECRRLNLPGGAEDLLLRPADEGAALCDRCGLAQDPPGIGLAPRAA